MLHNVVQAAGIKYIHELAVYTSTEEAVVLYIVT